jgi:hypothetical protein
LLYALKESTQVDLLALSQLVTQECDRLDWGAIGQKTFEIFQAISAPNKKEI